MSLKNRLMKKISRDVRRQKREVVNQIAKELKGLPFKERAKLAWRIAFAR